MCTQSTTYTTTTSSTVGYTAMTSSGNEIHLTVKDAEMSNVDMVGLVHEISNSTYTSCNCLTGTNDWELKASTWVGGLRANNNNFTLAIIDGTGNVLATQTAQTNGNITALTYLSVKATGLGTGPYYAVISYNKNSGSGDGFLNMHGWTLLIREDVPTTEAVVESNAFSFQPSYRYAFQGQERDDELKGSGNSYNYTYRMHDPRLGRFLSIDPISKQYPFYSPYSFSGNRVIDSRELEGLEPMSNEIFDAAKRAGVALLKKATAYAVMKVAEATVDYAAEKTAEKIKENTSPEAQQVIGLTGEFAFGVGDANRTFGPDEPITKALKDAPKVNEARNMFLEKNAENIANGTSLEALTDFGGSFGLTGLVKAGLDPAEQFVGSMDINIFPSEDGKSATFVITNSTSYESASYRAGESYERGERSSDAGSTTRQTYIFTESIPQPEDD